MSQKMTGGAAPRTLSDGQPRVPFRRHIGDVIHWAAFTFAGLVLLYFLAGSLISTGADTATRLGSAGAGAAIALLCWLIGRAARYLLSGV